MQSYAPCTAPLRVERSLLKKRRKTIDGLACNSLTNQNLKSKAREKSKRPSGARLFMLKKNLSNCYASFESFERQFLHTFLSSKSTRSSALSQKTQVSPCFVSTIWLPWSEISSKSFVLILRFSRISICITTLPKASTGLVMPVVFIVKITPLENNFKKFPKIS